MFSHQAWVVVNVVILGVYAWLLVIVMCLCAII